jgi:glycosyltransferase involved in cell wall biosynthesis
MRLGVLASHPIQYQAPLFRALASRLDLQVHFAHRQTGEQQAEAGFGTPFEWDVPLLDGYGSVFLRNRAARPSVARFNGCDTPEIAALIGAGKFDAFMVTGWNLRAHWQAVAACRKHGVPVLMRGDALLHGHRSYAKRVLKALIYPRLLQRFDRFCVVGRRFREYLLHYRVPEDAMFFSPHHVDNAWFAARARLDPGEREAIRRRLGAGREALVLFVGKLLPVKRPFDLLEAIARLSRDGPPVRLAIAGSGPLQDEMEGLARRSSLPVAFLGFQNQSLLPKLYSSADALVLPSQTETWGLVVNEAMACGTPAVVSSGVGCAPDLIEEGVTGTAYPCGDVAALAQAIARTVQQGKTDAVCAGLRRRMSRYSADTAASGIIEAVRSARHG